MVSSSDESSLLERAKSGDERAFAALVTPLRNRLWGICLRTTGNHADAEDALQDALIAAWKHLGTFRGDAGVATWIYRIAAHSALAIVRRRRDVTTFDDLEIVDPRRDLDDDIADRDLVQRALETLPEHYRVAVVLREFGDLTYEQIAEHQGIPVQTVRSRINRGRKALAAAITDARAGT